MVATLEFEPQIKFNEMPQFHELTNQIQNQFKSTVFLLTNLLYYFGSHKNSVQAQWFENQQKKIILTVGFLFYR